MPAIEAIINSVALKFKTSPTLFSPSAPDKGTLAMLKSAEIEKQSKVLDLGCGWGLVGIYAAKLIGSGNVFMTDISETAVEFSCKNAVFNKVEGVTIIQSDGFKDLNEKDFSLILLNPPYHADFSVVKHFIEKGFNRLALGGSLMMVTKRKDWYKNKLISIFGGVEIKEVDGYYIFKSQKRSIKYAKRKEN